MIRIDKPITITEKLPDPEEVLLDQVVIDMDREGHFCPGRILLTKESLTITWKDGQEEIALAPSEVESLAVDELLSTCRFYANTPDGRMLLTYTSFTAKDDLYRLAGIFGKFKEGREDEIVEEENDKFCPRCGRRYPDRERQFCPNCMDKGKVIKRMSGFFLKYRWYVAAIIGAMLALSAISVVMPYFSSAFFYDEVLNKDGRFFGQLTLVILIIISMRVVKLLITMLHGIVTSRISAKIVYDIKKIIFSAIERLSMGYFTARTTGGLMNQVHYDANRIYWFFTDGFPYFVINIVQLVAVTVIMVVYNPLLTLLALGFTPLVLFLIGKLFRKSRKLNHQIGRAHV